MTDISNVLRFCGDLLFEEYLGDHEDDDESITSEATMGFEAFCESMRDDVPPRRPSFKEQARMITCNDTYSGGSVEVARGGRMGITFCKGPKCAQRQALLKEARKRRSVCSRQAARMAPREAAAQ